MADGRGSAFVAVVLAACLVALFHCEVAEATTFTVGDSAGWTYEVSNWPNGKTFRAGDTLVFSYNRANHNVVVVNKEGYDTCTTPANAKAYQTGHDEIQLQKGETYFICNFTGHCESGMKIAINAV